MISGGLNEGLSIYIERFRVLKWIMMLIDRAICNISEWKNLFLILTSLYICGRGKIICLKLNTQYWKEDIDYDEFQKEVLDKAKQYIEEIVSYNSNFLETKDYQKLVHF